MLHSNKEGLCDFLHKYYNYSLVNGFGPAAAQTKAPFLCIIKSQSSSKVGGCHEAQS